MFVHNILKCSFLHFTYLFKCEINVHASHQLPDTIHPISFSWILFLCNKESRDKCGTFLVKDILQKVKHHSKNMKTSWLMPGFQI